MEIIYNFYFDNGVFRQLIKPGNEQLYKNLYESLNRFNLSLESIRVYFTAYSFLEAIGEGNFLENNKNIIKLALDQYNINDNISVDLDTIDQIIENTYHRANNYFLNHPTLKKDHLIKRIETQLCFSGNNATENIIEDTLKRYENCIKNQYESFRDSLAVECAWDAICSHNFIVLDQTSENHKNNMRKIIRKIGERLLRIFHDVRKIYQIDLNSSRLTNNIVSEFITDSNLFEKPPIDKALLLVKNKDFSDADYIHFATLGSLNDSQPIIILTCDTKPVIMARLQAQLWMINFLKSAEKSQLTINPGIICIVDPETLTIIEKIDVKNYFI